MNNKIYCSTGTIIGRENNYDFNFILQNAGNIEADGFELMMLKAYYENFDIMAKLFARNNLFFPILHTDKDIGTLISTNGEGDFEEAIRLFESNCKFAGDIGAEKIVLHLWGGPDSDKNLDNNIFVCERLLEIATKNKLKLMIENIPCAVWDPLVYWNKLYKLYKDVYFILDTRFLAFHEQIESVYDTDWFRCENLIHMHVSDLAGKPHDFSSLRPILHPNEGLIDFKKFFDKLKTNYNNTITLESPVLSKDGLDIEKLNKSLKYIKEAMENL
ncbi:MAG: sugar phosphate isomerase/epimerase [Oscillospiraceae bacterium]|nr:sugar phosphate isomerase/epimerase [Oscillospiraceae bacterium]